MVSTASGKAIALQRTPAAVVATAVGVARDTLGSDVAFAAAADSSAGFPIVATRGTRTPRSRNIVVRPHTGLGGQVLMLERPMIVADYATDPRIGRDFIEIVSQGEGLREVACVPVFGPAGIEALLYAGAREEGMLGDRAVEVLEHLSMLASVGLAQIRARELEIDLARLHDRERLASQLHDSVAQRLFTIGAVAHASRDQADRARLVEAIEEIDVTAAEAQRELRATLLQLHRASDELAFDEQLEGELRLLESVIGCRVHVARRGTPRKVPDHLARLMIDIAIEGARNAVKHARARLVAVEIDYGERTLVVAVEAPLVTWPERARDRPARGTGIGICTLRTRAERLGGSLALTTIASGQAVLRLELPCYDLISDERCARPLRRPGPAVHRV